MVKGINRFVKQEILFALQNDGGINSKIDYLGDRLQYLLQEILGQRPCFLPVVFIFMGLYNLCCLPCSMHGPESTPGDSSAASTC